jgi:hypothetical protein
MTLFQLIRTLVNSDQYLIGLHASERLEQRGVHEWQIIAAMPDCELLMAVSKPERVERSGRGVAKGDE